MNLTEALKSQKPFKRKGWATWFDVTHDGSYATNVGGRSIALHALQENFIADDWEIKQDPVEFECTWVELVDSEVVYPSVSPQEGDVLKDFVGRKTKVVVTIID